MASSWDAYQQRKKQAQQQRRPPAQNQPDPAPRNPYLPPDSTWTVAQDTSEEAHWSRRAQELSEQNRQERPTGWTVPAFNAHFNQAEAETERAALNERVQAVARSDKGGVWRGLRLPPGSRFRPGKNEMVNGDGKQPHDAKDPVQGSDL